MSDQMTRRALLGTTLASATLGGLSVVNGEQVKVNTQGFLEPERVVAEAGDFDVVVCGGGPAGIAAAISAARSGASVQILEAHGCLGGVWTSGMLSYVIDARKPGLNTELIQRLEALNGQITEGKNYAYDVETMKFVLEEFCRELKIKVQYHTRIVSVLKNDANRIEAVITESKSGRQAWKAAAFIDSTGDGDVGALAGCEWEFGRDKDCPCQPMSLMGIITASPDVLQEFSRLESRKNKDRLRAEIQRAGMDPSYAKPTLWYMGGSIAAVMINHEYSVRPFDAAAVTRATMNARRELFQITGALRKLGDGWKDCRLVTTAEQIGVRDGRRIKGRYYVDVNDVKEGARHEDAICRSTFSVDIHAATLEENKVNAYSGQGVKAKPFDIPLRSLIARDVDGLLMAGRCISGDFFAHASYRVTGNSVAMGEAAGITAAISSKNNTLPHQVPWPQVAQKLDELRGT